MSGDSILKQMIIFLGLAFSLRAYTYQIPSAPYDFHGIYTVDELKRVTNGLGGFSHNEALALNCQVAADHLIAAEYLMAHEVYDFQLYQHIQRGWSRGNLNEVHLANNIRNERRRSLKKVASHWVQSVRWKSDVLTWCAQWKTAAQIGREKAGLRPQSAAVSSLTPQLNEQQGLLQAEQGENTRLRNTVDALQGSVDFVAVSVHFLSASEEYLLYLQAEMQNAHELGQTLVEFLLLTEASIEEKENATKLSEPTLAAHRGFLRLLKSQLALFEKGDELEAPIDIEGTRKILIDLALPLRESLEQSLFENTEALRDSDLALETYNSRISDLEDRLNTHSASKAAHEARIQSLMVTFNSQAAKANSVIFCRWGQGCNFQRLMQ